MIPLMKNAFLNEVDTKLALSEFIIHTQKLSMDIKCQEFEKEFAKYQGRKNAILFNSGGSANLALLQSLKNLNILKTNDKVGFSALTWSTNVMPIFQMGLDPIPVDCKPETLNVMSENLIDTQKNDKIKALFITNALGFTGDIQNIKKICENENIILLEDNCESLGTELNEGKSGNFGLASTFSFFVAHHMSTIEGGMVCTDDDDLAEMLCIVRANGWDRNLQAFQQRKWRNKFDVKSEFEAKYTFYDLGFNFRPTEITGFLGLYQLQFLNENINVREKNYISLENIIKNNDDLVLLDRRHIKKLSSFAFPVICKNQELKDIYLNQFSGAGIEIRPMIAGNLQKQPFFKKYKNQEYNLQGADFVHNCGFYCGNYPDLTKNDLEVISSCLIKY